MHFELFHLLFISRILLHVHFYVVLIVNNKEQEGKLDTSFGVAR